MDSVDVVNETKVQLTNLRVTNHQEHIKTGDIRSLSAKLFKQIKDKSIESIFSICEDLLNQHNWALGVIAFDFAYRVKNQYNDNTFDVFESWLERFVRGWEDCDDFCTHAFGHLIIKKARTLQQNNTLD